MLSSLSPKIRLEQPVCSPLLLLRFCLSFLQFPALRWLHSGRLDPVYTKHQPRSHGIALHIRATLLYPQFRANGSEEVGKAKSISFSLVWKCRRKGRARRRFRRPLTLYPWCIFVIRRSVGVKEKSGDACIVRLSACRILHRVSTMVSVN